MGAVGVWRWAHSTWSMQYGTMNADRSSLPRECGAAEVRAETGGQVAERAGRSGQRAVRMRKRTEPPRREGVNAQTLGETFSGRKR